MKNEKCSDLLDRKEAADYLRICRNTLDKLRIPRIQIRKRVFYRRLELEQWIIHNTKIKGA